MGTNFNVCKFFICITLFTYWGLFSLSAASPKPLKKGPWKPCYDSLSAVVTHDWVRGMQRESHRSTNQEKLLRSSFALGGTENVGLNADILHNHDSHYTLVLPRGQVTDQCSSGRCWLLAGTNTFVSMMLREKKVPIDFRLSENYLWFFNFIEQINTHYEELIRRKRIPHSALRLRRLLTSGTVEEGGYWDYFSYLVDKYGLVPYEQMPDTASSIDSGDLISELMMQVGKGDDYFRGIIGNKEISNKVLQEHKTAILEQVWRILVTHLGTPPVKFNFKQLSSLEEVDPDGKVGVIKEQPSAVKTYTPLEFRDDFVGIDPKDFVLVRRDPNLAVDRRYRLRGLELGKVSRGDPKHYFEFLNVSFAQLTKLLVKSLKAGTPLYAGVEIFKDVDHDTGIMHPDIFGRDSIYGREFEKADRSMNTKALAFFRWTRLEHAVVIRGLDMPEGVKKPHKFLVLNSWGEDKGDNGEYHMYYEWIKRHPIEIVVPKSLLTKKQLKILSEKPTVIHPDSSND